MCGFLTRQTFFCACMFNAAYFFTLQGKNDASKTRKRVFKTCFKAESNVLM